MPAFTVRRLGLRWGGPRRNTRPFKLADPNILSSLPPWADVRPNCPVGYGHKVFDQGNEGSCVGNGVAVAAFAALMLSGEANLFIPSRQGIYDLSRIDDGDFDQDNGTTISQALAQVMLHGVWPEDRDDDPANEPYPGTFAPMMPTSESLSYGRRHLGLSEAHVDQAAIAIKSILASGFPVICGFQVFTEDMDVASRTGSGIMPRNPGGNLEGGHCVTLVGYNDTDQPQAAPGFEFAPIPPGLMTDCNSWGEQAGDYGYLHFAQSRVLSADYFSDFGALQKIAID